MGESSYIDKVNEKEKKIKIQIGQFYKDENTGLHPGTFCGRKEMQKQAESEYS